jgi:hypothetical protein
MAETPLVSTAFRRAVLHKKDRKEMPSAMNKKPAVVDDDLDIASSSAPWRRESPDSDALWDRPYRRIRSQGFKNHKSDAV